MRILYVTAHYPPDFTSGATLQLERIARTVAAAGHEVAVLSGAIRLGLADGETRTETETEDGVAVHWIGTAERVEQDDDANWLNPAATAYAAAVMDRWRPDVVHAHALQTLGADLLAEAASRGIPTVLTMHDLWWWCARLFLVDTRLQPCPLDTTRSDCACSRTAAWRRDRAVRLGGVLEGVDQVLVPSVALRDVVLLNGVPAARVDVDENDVDPATHPSSPSPAAPTDGVRFLYVGGDHPLKGRDVLLAAARRLRSRPAWRLTMFGVRRPARRRPWPAWDLRRVRFEPPYAPTNAAAVYSAADVLVIPSVARESFSLVAREALAAGLAVITSDCLGPTEVIHDGANGVIVPIGDDVALAEAMQRLIDDRELLDRLRTGARSDPPELRRPAEHAGALVRRYERLVADRELGDRFRAGPQQ
jgi:glycosyltransferase involved in cell wall biosynthesis